MYDLESKYRKGNLTFFTKDNPRSNNGVWTDCPRLAMLSNPGLFHQLNEDFVNVPGYQSSTALGGWVYSQSSSGAIGLQDLTGGVLKLDSDAVTKHHGCQLQMLGESFTPASDKELWFEGRFKITGASKAQMFFGLAEIGTQLLLAGDLDASTQYLGLGIETGNAETYSLYTSNGATERSDEIADLVSDTYVKVGLKLDGDLNLTCYIDDSEVSLSNVETDYLPDTQLTPTLIMQTDGSAVSPVMYVDYINVVQRRT